MRVLVIDDDKNSIEPLLDDLNEQEHEACFNNFVDESEILKLVSDTLPDLLVLDLKNAAQQSGDNDIAGSKIFEQIWQERFFPVLIYSAYPDLVLNRLPKNPFIGRVTKGANSEKEVINWINGKQNVVELLHEIDNEVAKSKHDTLKSITHYLGEGLPEAKIVSYLIKRRVAALMDIADGDISVPACFRYIYPPICKYSRMGDVIAKRDSKEFWIILTPSCDMGDDGQEPKVKKVIAARCYEISPDRVDEFKFGKKKNKIRQVLTQGHQKEFIPIPSLPEKFPHLVVNFKEIELIPIEEIGDSDNVKYRRIVSIDSPYREQISWAFIQVAGRPGVPSVDIDKWAEELEVLFGGNS